LLNNLAALSFLNISGCLSAHAIGIFFAQAVDPLFHSPFAMPLPVALSNEIHFRTCTPEFYYEVGLLTVIVFFREGRVRAIGW